MIQKPLAERLRPSQPEEVIGQGHILAPGQPLYQVLNGQGLHSMILWGPPGTGKTTLAKLICENAKAQWHQLSAVSSGVKDVRNIIQIAQQNQLTNTQTVLFIDEVHRFNKSQQDAFLPCVEDGTVFLVGATTENPAFELNNALLSRARVYVLKLIGDAQLGDLIDRALSSEKGLANTGTTISKSAREILAQAAEGDARRLLGFLETASDLVQVSDDKMIRSEHIEAVISTRIGRFDKGGDYFYDQISAVHKAVRGSNPDAAIYWATRMLQSGCDPHYLLRRVLRMASEDIGNADPRALTVVTDAWSAYDRLGSPEGELTIMQAIIYLAVAPKSNATYVATKSALVAAKNTNSYDVPLHLRNAPTKLAKSLEHGKGYQYAHNEASGFSPGQSYFPDNMEEAIYYEPVERGLEIKISAKLRALRAQNKDIKK